MQLMQLAAVAAALAVLMPACAQAQLGPTSPPPPQSAPEQSPPPPDQSEPPPGGAQSGPEQPGPVPPGPPPGLRPQAGGPPPAVAATNVNLRQGPGTNYGIVTTIPAGAPIDVSGCGAGWCQVTFQGQNGYVIATALGQGRPLGPPPGPYPPGYMPPPPPIYPPPYYGPYPYGYYGPGPYWRGYYGGWHRHW